MIRDQRGITIIETTVVLSVLFILAGAMAPIVGESVGTARAVRAKNDASMIAMALVNLQKDLGVDGMTGAGAVVTQAVRLPEILASAGEVPQIDDKDTGEDASLLGLLTAPAGRGKGNENGNGGRNARRAERRKWRESVSEDLDDHLSTNRKGYKFRRPGETGGWNGPYISAKLKGDPWGNQYLVNSEFLDGGTTAADAQGRTRRAVFVVSPGGNGIVETPFDQPITEAQAAGDDIVIRLQ